MKTRESGTMKKRKIRSTDIEIRKSVGRNIREMRDKLHHSAANIAKELGISREALTHIETGRNNINAISIWKLAVLFGCDIKDFFPKIPEGYGLSKIDTKLLAQEDEKAAIWAEELFGKK